MRKIIIYIGFIIASLVMIAVFINATTYTQLAVAASLYPLLVFYGFKAFPRKSLIYTSKKPLIEVRQVVKSAEKVDITDSDKRAFLKLIGGVGLTFFLLSIFNKKAADLFSKSLPGSRLVSPEATAGNKIDPVQNQATDGYKISEIDNNVISFYGFINIDGAWYIMKEDTENGSFRYTRGDSNFPSNWANRQNLKYDYLNNVFNSP